MATLVYYLDSIKVNKAPGPDGIHSWILKDLSCVISKPLFPIFRDSHILYLAAEHDVQREPSHTVLFQGPLMLPMWSSSGISDAQQVRHQN